MTVLTTEGIAQNLQDASATNGWDAVFAMNLAQVNSLFFQEFLDIGPANTRAETALRCALMDGDSTLVIVDVALGPPKVSFRPGSSATVEMDLMEGVLLTLDLDSLRIVNAVRVRPNESKLTGSLALAKVKGEVNQIGAVVMDLGASAYIPTISGVEPLLDTKIGDAIQTFFRENAAAYTIGIIGNVDVARSLTPSSFAVTTQQHPTKPDSCVLVLIQTDGSPGNVAPLPTYPVPDNSGAALIIAERPLFSALSDDLNKTFSPFGTTFSAKQGSPGWSVVGGGGSINCGTYGNFFDCNHENEWDRSDKMPWSSDGNGNLTPVQIQLDGFTVFGSNGQLTATWTNLHSQNVSELYRNPPIPPGIISLCATRTNPSKIQVDFKVSGTPSVDPGSSIVSFRFSNPTLTVKYVDGPNWWQRMWGATTITDAIIAVTKQSLLSTLSSFTAVSVDAFRLKCLLFQSPATVQLRGAALPGGVYLTGDAVMPITVTPASANVQPGGTVQFSAAAPSGAKVAWRVAPGGCGTIDAAGRYTAPASVSSAEIAVVTAIDSANTTVYGSAMVLVYEPAAAKGVAVLPSRSVVTPHHHVKLFTTDAAGNPLNVTWTLPPGSGTIVQGFVQGEYTYAAPPEVSEATEVTAVAVNAANPAQTGTAIIQLTPATSIDVQPPQSSVKFGTKLPLTATVTAGDSDNLRWVVFPSGSGTVVFDLSDPTKATYTAPDKAPSGGSLVHVVAYLVDDEAAGSGSIAITLTP